MLHPRFTTLLVALLFGCCASLASAECDPRGTCCDDTACCSDGVDNDRDGAIDCDDPDCDDNAPCLNEPEVCDDGEDNDGDGAADCDDPDCSGDPACATESDCDDGEDNDGDGLVDCADRRDCSDDPACMEMNCSDSEDDDGDGLFDCDDPDCAGRGCCVAPERCDDLVDNDGDGLIDCEDLDRCIDADVCAAPPEVCDDGVDDDGDGLADCADPECVRFPSCPTPPERDVAPPEIAGSLDEVACLWPANHWWVCFSSADFAVTATGDCPPIAVVLVDCLSDQPADDRGDGHFEPDCVVSPDGVCVRAERDGRDPAGRRYTITAAAVDGIGQVSEPQPVGTIFVPHDLAPSHDCIRTHDAGQRELPDAVDDDDEGDGDGDGDGEGDGDGDGDDDGR